MYTKVFSAIFLALLIVSAIIQGCAVVAAKFNLGNIVEVINSSIGGGLRVRVTPAGTVVPPNKYDGDRGMILAGPQTAYLGGTLYTWWKIRWQDAREGWSAEGDYADDYLRLVSVSPSTRFSMGDSVKVQNTGLSGLNVRTDPPSLSDTGTNVYDDTTGTVVGGPFYGVAEGKAGFYHFWKINYGSVVGWSAEDWLTKVVIAGEPTITSSLVLVQSPPYYVGNTITAKFTITNKATVPFTFDVLTVGGRDPDGQVADFAWASGITLNPGVSYNYQGTLTLAKVGNYHFFCAYRRTDGSWNPAVPTESGVTNTLDIVVGQISPPTPRTWIVDDDGPADFHTIQEAVDTANPGDTIIVRGGTYTENVEVHKDHLTIKSESGAEATIVQATNPDYHVFHVTEDYVEINGFTVAGATSSGPFGIVLDEAQYCSILKNIASGNFGGIELRYSNNNNIASNVANFNQNHGIFLEYSDNNIVTSNVVRSNDFFGITLYSGSNNNIVTNNDISENLNGIRTIWDANSNAIYLNNVVNNDELSGYSYNSISIWNSPEEITYTHNGVTYTNFLGNYWSDYTDVDLNNDGIWDHPYVIDENNQDNYPLVNPWPETQLKFRVGDQVRTTANLNVREGPGLGYALIDTMPEGTLGQIVGGPVEADGYVWWEVDYAVGVRGWSAEDWLELADEPLVCGRPVLISPLEISPGPPYFVGDTLTAKFTIRNDGDAAITLSKLLLGGRFNDGTLPNGQFPDFTFQTVTLQQEQTHPYEGTLELTEAGNYHFFIAYYIESPSEEEKKLLDENNWNTCIDLAEGLTDQHRIRDITVTTPSPPPKSTKFSAGDVVTVQKYNRLYKERRLDSDSNFIYENERGRIIENENNGIFADGHFWWYIELQPIAFEYWVLEDAIVKNQRPIPSLNYAPQHPKRNEEVVFDASGSQDTDGKIERYTWYLNGKFIGWTENPFMFYAFEKEGDYSLKLEVTDDSLETASTTVTFKVEGKASSEKIKKIISKDDIIKIADDLDIYHYTRDYGPLGLWHTEFFVLNDKTYSEDELLAVLNKPIKKIGETGELAFVEDVIYGMRIRNILEDAKLVDLTSSGTWNPEPDDFKNLKKANTWVETIVNWEEPFLSRYLEVVAYTLDMPLSAVCHIVGGLIGPILTIAEGYKVYETLDFLEDILYKRALWHYMQIRIGDPELDSVEAFDSILAVVPIEYTMSGRAETTRKSWEELYQTYEPYIIPGEGGLGENFEEIKAELRRHIYDTMESYSLMPREFVAIGSVGELRVYDSEGRVTGIVNGEIREEISYSMYDEDTETIIIFPAIGSYHYGILGIDEGTYSLRITSVEYGNMMTFTATDIPTSLGATHQYTIDWDALSLGEEGVTVQADSNDDGVFEHTFNSDSELTQSEYVIATDDTPPQTWLSIGEPKLVVNDITYLTSVTPIELIAEDDPSGSGVASTAYRIHNATYSNDWIAGAETFYLVGLSDGTYQIDYNSTDNAGNVEPTNTATVILDNTPPATSITIGAPNFVTSSSTFVTSETSFALSANDNLGSGVVASFYEIYNSTYNGGWLTCKGSFCLTKLAVGNYTIAYYSVDNVGNQESVHSVKVSLFSWTYSFSDYYGRKTTLRINIEYKLFWFAAPGKDFGIKHDLKMIVLKNAIAICYNDGTMRLEAVAIVGKINFCSAVACDKQTNKIYLLISRLPPHVEIRTDPIAKNTSPLFLFLPIRPSYFLSILVHRRCFHKYYVEDATNWV